MSDIDYSKENIKILDSIDFSPYFKHIKRGENVWTFFNAIEDEFDHTQLANNDILEGYIFNWLGEIELIEYFEKRYPNEFKTIECTEYRFC